jgi:hypothetical protein
MKVPFNTKFTVFNLENEPLNYSLIDIFEKIKLGNKPFIETIGEIRSNTDLTEKSKLISKIYRICFNGLFSQRSKNGFIEHSGLCILEFKNLISENDYNNTFEKLKNTPFVVMAFRSCNGNGIIALARIPKCTEIEHESIFESLKAYFNSPFFDSSNKDILKECFESYDPEIYLNQFCEIFSGVKKEGVSDFDNNELLNDAFFTSIVKPENTFDALINQCEINLLEPLTPPPVAMQIKSNGNLITLFSKGNFSVVTGKAKSRKSYLISIAMATAIKGENQNHFFCNTNGMNILFDTEQSKYKVQQVTKRICSLAGVENPENFKVYSLRVLEPVQRLNFIDYILSTTENLNFVAIDGIIDLGIDPILQAEQAQIIITKLMQWTEKYNIHIVCVLHYNKTVSTLLGHLGSFAHRKADCVIEVEKDSENKSISNVTPVDCREMEFEPFSFSINENGLPYILEDYSNTKPIKEKSQKPEKKRAITPQSLTDKIHSEILENAFKIEREQTYSDLWKNIKLTVSQSLNETIGDNKAKDFITYYLQKEMIIKFEKSKKIYYTMQGQKGIEF